MSQLGILVRDLGASELNWHLVRQANESTDDVIFFYDELLPSPVTVQVAHMPTVEAWGYTAPLIATTLGGAKKLLSFPATAGRFFYVWDLEWLRMVKPPYRALQEVYGSDRLTLIARTQEQASLLEDLWCRPVPHVVPRADLRALSEIVRGD